VALLSGLQVPLLDHPRANFGFPGIGGLLRHVLRQVDTSLRRSFCNRAGKEEIRCRERSLQDRPCVIAFLKVGDRLAA
jgi:hypothetical protein